MLYELVLLFCSLLSHKINNIKILYFSCGDGVVFRSRMCPIGLCYNSMASTVVSVSETVDR